MDEATAGIIIAAIYVIVAIVLVVATIATAVRGRKDIAIICGSTLAVWIFSVFGGVVLLIVAIVFFIKGNMMVGWSIVGGIAVGTLGLVAYDLIATAMAVTAVTPIPI